MYQTRTAQIKQPKNTANVKSASNKKDTLFGLPLYPETDDHPERSLRQADQTAQSALKKFSADTGWQELTSISEDVWLKRGQRRALGLFHAAAEYVPAYRDFLQRHKVNPASIQSFTDFEEQVPILDKDTYLKQYPLEQLIWHGQLPGAHMIVASSGSYGPPSLWPRGPIAEAQNVLEHEQILVRPFELNKFSTLALVCFNMGMHIAGTITMQSLSHLNKKGYPISVMTPGAVMDDILSVIGQLAPKYDQVLLVGYPPYLKEVIDQGKQTGIKWEKLKLRFLMAAEGFNESWRTYVAELSGADPDRDFINIYGSADAGAMGHETPTSIAIRRHIADDVNSHLALFNDERLPALYQNFSENKYFEAINGELVVTTASGLPLVRYNIHEQGGILSHESLQNVPTLSSKLTALRRKGELLQLPFVYIFGRGNQVEHLYGINVYLEHIRKALEDSQLRTKVTGKMIMHTELDQNKNQRLHIDVEGSPGVRGGKRLQAQLTKQIHQTLLIVNSEYRNLQRIIGDRVIPIVKIFPHQHENFRPRRMKQRWVKKNT